MKTFSPTPEHIDHQWFVVDADNQVLGRLAAQIAHRLRGKHKPEFCLLYITLDKLLAEKPADVLMHAVRGMLPKNRLGRAMLKKLKVYAGPTHPHTAQGPKPLSFPY